MKVLAFIVDFGAAKATVKSLELSAQEPESLPTCLPTGGVFLLPVLGRTERELQSDSLKQ